MKEVMDRNTDPVIKLLLARIDPVKKLLLARTDPVNKLLLTRTFSNVCSCWLAMPLGAGVLRWVLACHTIEKKKKSNVKITVCHY